MIEFDLPFIPDEGYAAFLARNVSDVASLHFSLHLPGWPDGRHPAAAADAARLEELLSPLAGPRKYGLLNARFHGPDHYRGPLLDVLVARLDSLARAGALDGLVVGDFLLLKALGRAAPSLAASLEAAPGVNLQLDTPAKVSAWLEYLPATGFKAPAKVVLDRGCNRDLPALADFRAAFPGLRVVLLANEGCLARCPFKPAHDSHISHALLSGDSRVYALGRELGCGPLFLAEPWRLLASPWIRPEDAAAYQGFVLKLCGRTQGPRAMERIIAAYRAGSSAPNLLELLDAVEGLAGVLELDATALPPDFLARVGRCGGRCDACGWCREVAQKVVQRRVGLVPLRAGHTPGTS